MQHFLVKLIPPRSTFAQDMNDEERKLMQEHAVYWKELQEKGIALAYGPVLEPTGAWGLGIIEVEYEKAAKELLLNDPTIRSNLHTFEIHPMRAIVKGHNSR
jgi:YCII-related domain.